MPQSRSPRLLAGFIILLVLAGTVLFFTVFRDMLQSRADQLRLAIETVKSHYAFARIQVLEKSPKGIRVKLTILNQEGQPRGSDTFSLPGNDVYLESRIVHCRLEEDTRAFVFPWRVFTEQLSPAQGKDIRELYLEEGSPRNYQGDKRSDTLDQAILDLYRTAWQDSDVYDDIREQYIIDIYDSSLHLGILGTYQAGRSYICIIHPNGGLELKEE